MAKPRKSKLRRKFYGLGAVKCQLSLSKGRTELGYGPSRKQVVRDMLYDARRDSQDERGTFSIKRTCGTRTVTIGSCTNGKCKLTKAGKRSFGTIPGIAGGKRRK